MKKIILLKNTTLLILIALFGMITFSLINTLNYQGPEQYEYQDPSIEQQGSIEEEEYNNSDKLTNEKSQGSQATCFDVPTLYAPTLEVIQKPHPGETDGVVNVSASWDNNNCNNFSHTDIHYKMTPTYGPPWAEKQQWKGWINEENTQSEWQIKGLPAGSLEIKNRVNYYDENGVLRQTLSEYATYEIEEETYLPSQETAPTITFVIDRDNIINPPSYGYVGEWASSTERDVWGAKPPEGLAVIPFSYEVSNPGHARNIQLTMEVYDGITNTKLNTFDIPGGSSDVQNRGTPYYAHDGLVQDGYLYGGQVGTYDIKIQGKYKVKGIECDETLVEAEDITISGTKTPPELNTFNHVIEEMPTSPGASDGEIKFDYEAINEDDVEFISGKLQLMDTTDPTKPDKLAELITLDSDAIAAGSGEASFTGLSEGTYRIDTYTTYRTNEEYYQVIDKYSTSSVPIRIDISSDDDPKMYMSKDDITTLTPTKKESYDGKINFKFVVENIKATPISRTDVTLVDDVGRNIETISYHTPTIGTKTGQFTGLDSGNYSIEVDWFFDLDTTNDSRVQGHKSLIIKDIVVEQPKVEAPDGYIENARVENVTDENLGSLTFGFVVNNTYGANLTKIEINLWNSNNENYDSKIYPQENKPNILDQENIQESVTFDEVEADTYTLEMVVGYEMHNGAEFVEFETCLDKVEGIIISDPTDSPPKAINRVIIEENTFNVFVKVYDIQELLVDDSIEIIVKINDKEKYHENNLSILTSNGEFDILIDYKEEKIINWEIIISAEMKDSNEMFDGGTSWKQVGIYRENSINTNAFILVSVISFLLISIFIFLAVKMYKR